jgi:Beta-lactamase superfamily domain
VLEVQRLNGDTSWRVQWDDTKLLIDPWLVGSQIDGVASFNEQTHVDPLVSPAAVEPVDYVLISQQFSDHLHEETLGQLHGCDRFAAVPSAVGSLFRGDRRRSITSIPKPEQGWAKIGALMVARVPSTRRVPPVFQSLVIRNENDAVVYAPHGFVCSPAHLNLIASFRVRALLVSFSTYRIPSVLGGMVNPGREAAVGAIEKLAPEHVFPTHDERKVAVGVISKIAKRTYLDETVLRSLDSRIIWRVDLNTHLLG